MSKTLGDKFLSGLFWVFIDKFGTGGLNFIVNIILARILSPADFGLVAMVLIFFELSNAFVNSGFVAALVREKHISEEDKATTFTFNFLVAVLAYTTLYFSAPAIANFYSNDQLIPIVRVMGINIVIFSFMIIQNATFYQQIDFKTLTRARVATVTLSSTVAIILAFNGFGVWSLVIKFVLNSLIQTTLLYFLNPWTPRLAFYRESFNRLFGFGSRILASTLIDKFYLHIYALIIGRLYSESTLGFFAQADSYRKLVVTSLFETINKGDVPGIEQVEGRHGEAENRLSQNHPAKYLLDCSVDGAAGSIGGTVHSFPYRRKVVAQRQIPAIAVYFRFSLSL